MKIPLYILKTKEWRFPSMSWKLKNEDSPLSPENYKTKIPLYISWKLHNKDSPLQFILKTTE